MTIYRCLCVCPCQLNPCHCIRHLPPDHLCLYLHLRLSLRLPPAACTHPDHPTQPCCPPCCCQPCCLTLLVLTPPPTHPTPYSPHLPLYRDGMQVSDLAAAGGGDIPEDLLPALYTACGLRWTSKARFLLLITDAPCHGRDCNSDPHDAYPRVG